MEYYLQKTYYKTASLISNSCKAVAVLTGHTADVSLLAYEYGRNLVCEGFHSSLFLPRLM
jgi:geranyl diphosphate synthase